MKRTVQVILTGVLALILPVLACAGPYAPAVEIPDSRHKEFFPDMPKDGAEMLGMWPIVKKRRSLTHPMWWYPHTLALWWLSCVVGRG